jgi:hypothetical protein
VWTNAAPVAWLQEALALRRRPLARDRPLSAVLRPGVEVAVCATRSTPAPGFPCNRFGEPVVVLPCLVSYRDSEGFRFDPARPHLRHGVLRVRDSAGAVQYSAPTTEERDLILGFPAGFTRTVGNDDTRFHLQGQTVDQFQFGFIFEALDDFGVACARRGPPADPDLADDWEESTSAGFTVGVHFTSEHDAVLTFLAEHGELAVAPPARPAPEAAAWTVLPLKRPPQGPAVVLPAPGVVLSVSAAAPLWRAGAQAASAPAPNGRKTGSAVDVFGVRGLPIDPSAAAAGRVIGTEGEESELLKELDRGDSQIPLIPDAPGDRVPLCSLISFGPQLTAAERAAAEALVMEFSDVFARDLGELGDITLGGGLRITLKPDARPVSQRPRSLAADDAAAVVKEITQLLEQHIIVPSTSSWCANLVVVRKKNGERRICVDNRALNAVTEMDHYPFPQVQAIFDKVAASGARIFSVCDMYKGYWQIRIADEDQHLTAFAVPGMGQFEFRRVNFGLKTAPAAFVRMVDLLLRPLPHTEGFVDDLLTFSVAFAEALVDLRGLLMACRQANARLAPSKCFFFFLEVKYVGHMLSGDGVRPALDRVAAVRDAPDPSSGADELRRFLGMANYLRQYVRGYSALTTPLTALLRKGTPAGPWGPAVWTDQQRQACAAIRKALCEAPTLRHVVPNRRLLVCTDWSVNGGSGAVLSQRDESGIEYLCAFWSKTNTRTEMNYGAYKGELFAVLCAVQHWHCYLASNEFDLMTDHHALIWLFTAKELNGVLARYVLRLNEYKINVVYRPGVENLGADYLSRSPLPASGGEAGRAAPAGQAHAEQAAAERASCAAALSAAATFGGDRWRELQLSGASTTVWAAQVDTSDPWLDTALLECLRRGPSALAGLGGRERDRVQHRLRRYAWRPATEREAAQLVYQDGEISRLVPRPEDRAAIVRDVHSRMVTHLGVQRTYAACERLYRWPSMYAAVEAVVRACPACNLAKTAAPLRSLELHPLPVVPFFFRSSLDLAGPFPPSLSGSVFVLVVAEHTSRAVFLRALPNKEAASVAREFNYFCGTFGAPAEVLTDVGTEFAGLFDRLCTRLFIAHNVTSAYHPQGNGLTERAVQTVKRLLTACVLGEEVDSDWEAVLPSVQLAINTTPQASTKVTPYELVFGRKAGIPAGGARLLAPLPLELTEDQVVAELHARVREIQRLVPFAMNNLLTQQRRQTLAYARRTGGGGGFKHELVRAVPGNLVFLRDRTASNLQPAVRPGVFQVVEVRASGVLVIQGRNGRTTDVHAESAVPCHLRDTDIDLTIVPADEAPADLPCEWCSVCEQSSGGVTMLLCDLCQTGWHMDCLALAQQVAPVTVPRRGKGWYCSYCVRLGRVPVPVTAAGVVRWLDLADAALPLDLVSGAAVAARLQRDMPGPHGKGRGTALFNLMPGGPGFCEDSGHGSGFIATPAADYAVLAEAIHWDRLSTLWDPWAGTGGTARAFPQHTVTLTDVVSRTPRLAMLANALEDQHTNMVVQSNGGLFDAVVCSPAFAFLDLALPAALRSARHLVAMHVPGGYVTNAPPARRAFLQRLADAGLRYEVHGLPVLAATGVRHQWLVVFTSLEAVSRYWKGGPAFSSHHVFTSRQG